MLEEAKGSGLVGQQLALIDEKLVRREKWKAHPDSIEVSLLCQKVAEMWQAGGVSELNFLSRRYASLESMVAEEGPAMSRCESEARPRFAGHGHTEREYRQMSAGE